MKKSRRKYIAAFLLFVGAVIISAFPNPRVDNSALKWIEPDSSSARTYRQFQKTFGTDDVFVVYLKGSDFNTLFSYIERFDDTLKDDPIIERVISLKSANAGSWTKIVGGLGKNETDVDSLASGPLARKIGLLNIKEKSAVLYGLSALSSTQAKSSLDEKLHSQRVAAEKDGLTVYIAGNPLLNLGLDRAGVHVEKASLPILIGVCILVLLLLTRSPLTTIATLAPAGLVVKASEGVLWLFGVEANIVVNIAKPLLFVLLLASTLHVLVGWQDARAQGASPRVAPWEAVKKKGWGVVLALLTTAIGFGSLVLSNVPPIRNFGILAACGLVAGIPFILLCFPALLRGIRVPAKHDLGLGETAWWFCRKAIHYRVVFPLLGIGILAMGFMAAGELKSDPHAIHYFKPSHQLRRDHKALEKEGMGLATMEIVLGTTESLLKYEPLERVKDLAQKFSEIAGVKQVIDPNLLLGEAVFQQTGFPGFQNASHLNQFLKHKGDLLDDFATTDGKKCRLSLHIATLDASELSRVKTDVQQAFREVFEHSDVTMTITGNYEILLSTQAGLLSTLKNSLLLTTVLMSVLFVLILRSFKIALLALLPNLVPVSLNLFLMYLLKMPLDVGTTMTAAIALGIAVDDTLHFSFSWNPAHPDRTARSTGRAIILSSVIIGIGFISLVMSDFIPTQNFGILCSVAMASALLSDLLVLPPLLAYATGYRNRMRQEP